MQINQNLTTVNYNTGSGTGRIKYIVQHYTGNNGDTAYNNTAYFKSTNRGSSAHYFVDENDVWQCVADKDIAWHVGNDTYIHPYCRNNNSIGIEMCSRKDSGGNYYFMDSTIKNAAELTKYLMEKYNVPAANVIRHYDVTGKICPAPLVNATAWAAFKAKLKQEEIDMTKAEVQAMIKTEAKKIADAQIAAYHTAQNKKPVSDWAKEAWAKATATGVMDGTMPRSPLTREQAAVTYDRMGLLDK